VLSPELLDQFGNAAEFVLLAISLKSLAQTVGEFFRFDLKQHLVKQSQLAGIHVLDFVVQQGLQLFSRD
jgi:hypothetical protein